MKHLPRVIAAFFILTFCACVDQSILEKIPVVEKGVINLSGHDKEAVFDLSGDWEFYWGKLLSPEAFEKMPPADDFITVPTIWNNKILNARPLGSNGAATYRCRIYRDSFPARLAIRMSSISSAYALYVNGRLLASGGRVSEKKEDFIPGYYTPLVQFSDDSGKIEIVLQTANFFQVSGGVWEAIQFGPAPKMLQKRELNLAVDHLLFGIILIISVYHLGLYLFSRKDKTIFWFGLFSLFCFFYTITKGEKFYTISLEAIPWFIIHKILYISLILLTPSITGFMATLFKKEFSPRILKVIQFCAYILAGITLIFPAMFYTNLLIVYNILGIFSCLYILLVLFRGIRNKNPGAPVFLGSFIIFFLTIINDILHDAVIIKTAFLMTYGVVFLIFSQALYLSINFSRAFSTVEKLSKDLTNKTKRLMELDKLKDEFLANTSHELRTPLNGINALAESMLLDQKNNFSEKQIKNLGMIISSGRRLSFLVNDILDFSRLENRDITLNLKPTDLKALSRVIMDLLRPLAESKKLKIINRLEETELPLVTIDENRMEQILYNLLGNAIKFTDRGSITLDAQQENKEKLLISVSDTGIGIPAEKKEEIFNSFVQIQGDAARIHNGTGLGLSITKSLIELHNGQIGVESAPGRGARFFFTLPINQEVSLQPVISNSGAPKEENKISPGPLSPLKKVSRKHADPEELKNAEILIVDDEPINLEALKTILELFKARVYTAASGQQALSLLEEKNPDLIILDIMMPRMTGFDTAKKIREKFPMENLPIIFLTAGNKENTILEGFSSGGNDYLTKPFSKDELVTRIHFHISLSRSRKQLKSLNLQIKKLLTASREISKSQGKQDASLTAFKQICHFETDLARRKAVLYLRESKSEAYNSYLIKNDTLTLYQTPPEEDEAFIKSLPEITLKDGALLIPIRMDENNIGMIKIPDEEKSKKDAPSLNHQGAVESIVHTLALLLNHFENEENGRLTAIGAMAQNIVHDLKNAISIIPGLAKVAGFDTLDQKEREEILTIISDSSSRVTAMAQDILDFSRGEGHYRFDSISCERFFGIIKEEIIQLLKDSPVKPVFDFSCVGRIRIDTARFHRIFLNLIKNSRDVMRPGEAGEIYIQTRVRENNLIILFKDNGPGIPDSIKTTLFEPFITINKKTGIGLGLAIVKEIVRNHRGTIKLKEEPGACFEITLPME